MFLIQFQKCFGEYRRTHGVELEVGIGLSDRPIQSGLSHVLGRFTLFMTKPHKTTIDTIHISVSHYLGLPLMSCPTDVLRLLTITARGVPVASLAFRTVMLSCYPLGASLRQAPRASSVMLQTRVTRDREMLSVVWGSRGGTLQQVHEYWSEGGSHPAWGEQPHSCQYT